MEFLSAVWTRFAEPDSSALIDDWYTLHIFSHLISRRWSLKGTFDMAEDR